MVKLLLVDDDEDLSRILNIMFTSSNMLVKSLHSGRMLFETILAEKPDILLMDVFLGDTDGRVLCKYLKRSINYTGFPVFLYSAGDITSESAMEAGADYFLRKPFEMSQLVQRILESAKKFNLTKE